MLRASGRESQILGALWGAVTGDALGVPVEFRSREELSITPVEGMRGFGTHYQEPGTWSDDSSLILCSAESLMSCNGLNTRDMATRFRRWLMDAHWTPHGKVFDIGIATRQALARFTAGKIPERCGGRQEFDNGNGSLMRILPVSLWFANDYAPSALDAVHRASAITHAHPRSQMVCGFFSFLLRFGLTTNTFDQALTEAWSAAESFYANHEEFTAEWPVLSRLQPEKMKSLSLSDIRGTGYSVHTLEASVWCTLHATSWQEAVLQAVNLGEDADTTACVTGALAGWFFGLEQVPPEWRDVLARKEDIERLFQVFTSRLRI